MSEVQERKEHFSVIEICRDDIVAFFDSSPEAIRKIKQFSDSEMQDIADDMAALLGENYCTTLERAVEEAMEKEASK